MKRETEHVKPMKDGIIATGTALPIQRNAEERDVLEHIFFLGKHWVFRICAVNVEMNVYFCGAFLDEREMRSSCGRSAGFPQRVRGNGETTFPLGSLIVKRETACRLAVHGEDKNLIQK